VDPQTILWTDTDVYQRRYEKTATALMAVERVLRARRPLGGGEDEFLALYLALAAADPDIFTVIWQDPFAYFWARFAYELVGWCLSAEPRPAGLAKYCAALGTEDPQRALALHLGEFKKFIIALELKSGAGETLSRNFYWLAEKSEDYRALDALPQANVTVTATFSKKEGGEDHITVQLKNSGAKVALENKLTLINKDGSRILPAYYGDNYISLLPGETREIDISYPDAAAADANPQLTLRGWSLASQTIAVAGGN